MRWLILQLSALFWGVFSVCVLKMDYSEKELLREITKTPLLPDHSSNC